MTISRNGSRPAEKAAEHFTGNVRVEFLFAS